MVLMKEFMVYRLWQILLKEFMVYRFYGFYKLWQKLKNLSNLSKSTLSIVDMFIDYKFEFIIVLFMGYLSATRCIVRFPNTLLVNSVSSLHLSATMAHFAIVLFMGYLVTQNAFRPFFHEQQRYYIPTSNAAFNMQFYS